MFFKKRSEGLGIQIYGNNVEGKKESFHLKIPLLFRYLWVVRPKNSKFSESKGVRWGVTRNSIINLANHQWEKENFTIRMEGSFYYA